MKSDEVGFPEQGIQFDPSVTGNFGVVIIVNDIHSESFCFTGDIFTDIAQAYNAQGLSFQSESQVAHSAPHTFFFYADTLIAFGNPAGCTQHQGQCQLGRRTIDRFRGIGHSYTLFTGIGDIDIIITHSIIAD